MAQIPNIVDLTKGYIFTDPNAFADNRGHTQQQDTPTEMLPVVPMAGYNFLPTSYGYRSYFGDNSILDIEALPARCDHILLFQKADYSNIFVALCEDGIYTSSASIASSVWTKQVSYAVPTVGTHEEWTYALLENTLYCYRQGKQEVWKMPYTTGAFERKVPCTLYNYDTLVDMNAATFLSHEVGKLVYCYEDSSYYYISSVNTVVTYDAIEHGNYILNMAGQMGIFRANLRIGFWDSANSIAWSDLYDSMDFEPSVKTRAGNTTFSGILGRIVQILPQGSGFVIYSTKNILGIRFTNDIAFIWDVMVVSDTAGIAYPRQVCTGASESDHYAFTNTGLAAIGKYNPVSGRNDFQTILPEMYDILKESNEPVYMDFLQGRYLFLSLISSKYITGDIHIAFDSARNVTVKFLYNNAAGLAIFLPGETIPMRVLMAPLLAASESGTLFRWAAYCYKLANIPYDTYLSSFPRDEVGGIIYPVSIAAQPTITPEMAVDIVQGTAGYSAPHFEVAYDQNNARVVLPWDATIQGVPDNYITQLIAAQAKEWQLLVDIAAQDRALLQAAINAGSAIPYPTGVPSGNFALGLLNGIPVTKVDITPTFVRDILTGIITTPSMYMAMAIQTILPTGYYATRQGDNSYYVYSDTSPIAVPYSITAEQVVDTLLGTVTVTPTITNQFMTLRASANYQIVADTPTAVLDSVILYWVTDYTGDTPITANWLAPWAVHPFVITLTGTASMSGYSCIYTLTLTVTPPPAGTFHSVGTVTIDSFIITGEIGSGTIEFGAPFHVLSIDEASYSETILHIPLTLTSGGTPSPQEPTFAGWNYGTTQVDVPAAHIVTTSGSSLIPGTEYTDTPQVLSASQFPLDWTLEGVPESYSYTDAAIQVSGIDIANNLSLPPYAEVTYPGATFLLQDGSIVPIYPEFSGALVLDTHLKKLGKYFGSYTNLVEHAPINSNTPSLLYTNFGLSAGVLKSDGTLRAFSAKPTASYLKYGLYGLYRLGYTVVQEVKVFQRRPLDYTITLNSSLDGRNEEALYLTSESLVASTSHDLMTAQVGRWHTVSISGNYDLTGLEIRSTISGRR